MKKTVTSKTKSKRAAIGNITLLRRRNFTSRNWVALGAFMLLFSSVGVYVVTASRAATSAARFACGSQCNGKPASWVVPSNGIRCSASARVVAQGRPNPRQIGFKAVASTFTDPYVQVKVYYSPSCQTMWASISNSRDIGRTNCNIQLYRSIPPSAAVASSCPGAGHSITTAMIDDHAPNLGIAAQLNLAESTPGSIWAGYQFSY